MQAVWNFWAERERKHFLSAGAPPLDLKLCYAPGCTIKCSTCVHESNWSHGRVQTYTGAEGNFLSLSIATPPSTIPQEKRGSGISFAPREVVIHIFHIPLCWEVEIEWVRASEACFIGAPRSNRLWLTPRCVVLSVHKFRFRCALNERVCVCVLWWGFDGVNNPLVKCLLRFIFTLQLSMNSWISRTSCHTWLVKHWVWYRLHQVANKFWVKVGSSQVFYLK